MKNCNLLNIKMMQLLFTFICIPILSIAIDNETHVEYKGAKVMYFGEAKVSKEALLKEARLIDKADRRFEAKWAKKDYLGISEEYTMDGVFMKPGKAPKIGRKAIAEEFAQSVKGIDRVEFFQDELEFYGDLKSAYQRAHMKGYINGTNDFVFEGSYIILWKKVNNNWLIHYDMFNADMPTGSKIYYSGKDKVSSAKIMDEARKISVADRRFEAKWKSKDYIGISNEYIEDGVFMKPGVKPCVGRKEIAEEFEKSVAAVDRVTFFQNELEFLPGMKSAFQRAHMEGFINGVAEPIFKGSYTILWKKVEGNWLIHYDMFNADE